MLPEPTPRYEVGRWLCNVTSRICFRDQLCWSYLCLQGEHVVHFSMIRYWKEMSVWFVSKWYGALMNSYDSQWNKYVNVGKYYPGWESLLWHSLSVVYVLCGRHTPWLHLWSSPITSVLWCYIHARCQFWLLECDSLSDLNRLPWCAGMMLW